MHLHKEGYKTIMVVLLFVLAVWTLLNYFWPTQTWFHYLLYAGGLVLLTIVVRFFRVPHRQITPDESAVFSVADGTVVAIEEIFEGQYFKKNMRVISVFMSINNVHANFYPIAGEVCYTKYHPGKFFVASNPKSSEYNECSSIAIKHSSGTEVMFRQIAGFVARRIVTYSKVGDIVEQAASMGFIKFGSRIDHFVPLDAEVVVSLKDKVVGRQTILAKLNLKDL